MKKLGDNPGQKDGSDEIEAVFSLRIVGGNYLLESHVDAVDPGGHVVEHVGAF